MCISQIAVIGFIILFTNEHAADVETTIKQLQNQGVDRSAIILYTTETTTTVTSAIVKTPPPSRRKLTLSKIYKWLLNDASIERCFEYLTILEDDLFLSPNFVSYMKWGQRLLELDRSIGVVSAWNDNAVPEALLDPSVVLKTRQFMGLGWITRAADAYDAARSIIPIRPRPWDYQVAQYFLRQGLLSVFPQFPRVKHRTASFWKFDTLQVYNQSLAALPTPQTICENYSGYLKLLCSPERAHVATDFALLEQTLRKSAACAPWTTSAMTSRLYGEFNGSAVFPDRAGKQHIFSVDSAVRTCWK
ncbi:MAG: hypothetical protein CL678_00540 [Bdellovibrionaceae bacterium]|nr:hypothetical protein [Pseudobdellovibrionaceae bacterium]|tara:strand:- start:2601 stop:3512 length:912 start_codon:yes stop_codon:yes gene_type:complete